LPDFSWRNIPKYTNLQLNYLMSMKYTK
jgi:hypothetical protein